MSSPFRLRRLPLAFSQPHICARNWRPLTRCYSSKLPEKSPDSPSQDPVADALRDGSAAASSLLAPVHIPEDPGGVLQSDHPAASILANPSIIVHRQLEMMNVMLGFEQANKYVVLNPEGAHVGYIAEQELGMGNMMARQWLRTHRAFQTHVFDRGGREVLRFHRPFQWINSAIRVFDPLDAKAAHHDPSQPRADTALSADAYNATPSMLPIDQMRLIGQAQQQWAPLRRKYNLSLNRQSRLQDGELVANEAGLEYFAFINEPFLSWDFSLQSTYSPFIVGSVNRNFAGFGREIFTDTGVYALRMDAAHIEAEQRIAQQASKPEQTEHKVDLLPQDDVAMSLDERAVMLATAVSVDFDFFSRSRGGFFGMPFPIWMGGAPAEGAAGAAGGAAAGETAAGAGALENVGTGAAGTIARGSAGGAAESTAVGAGTMAGYEAMQRGVGRQQAPDDASPQAPGDWQAQQAEMERNQYPAENSDEVWGAGKDPWAEDQQQPPADQQQNGKSWWEDDEPGGGSGGGGDDGGGDWGDWF